MAGFFLASKGNIDFGLLVAVLLGLACIIGAASASNNYIDQKIDKKMARTKNRALVSGLVSRQSVIILIILLGLIGMLVLCLLTNFLTLSLALLGYFLYVVVYGIYKRRSVHGTLVGSLSGAIPPLVGYCAVTNHLDGATLILFLILIFWQMPHFYAIAMYRSKDYAAASIPVLPVVKGLFITKIQITLYVIAFTAAALALTIFGYTGYIYAVIATGLGVTWLLFAIKGFKTTNNNSWARKMFLFSLIVITVLCTTISVESFY